MPQLQIADREISYKVKPGKGKYGYLKLRPDFQLEIILPQQSSLDIHKILDSKRHWLDSKIKEMSQIRKIFEEDRVLFGGRYYLLKVFPVKKSKKGIRVFKKVIHIYQDQEHKKEEILRKFMEETTKEHIRYKTYNFAARFGLKPRNVLVKDIKKWSCCTKYGELIFNWRLAALPEDLIDYLIAHEVTHLKHFNHSKQFKKTLATFCLNYKQKDKLIKQFTWE